MPKNKRILGAALLLVLGLIFVFFAVSPWEILPFLKGGSFRVQAGIIGGFLLLGGITNLLHPKNECAGSVMPACGGILDRKSVV